MYSNTATLSKRPSSKLPVESVSNGRPVYGRRSCSHRVLMAQETLA
jgi:hypothetical protein